MNEKVTVPAELRAKLAGANGNPVPLCDESGTVIGYYVTPTRMATIEADRKAMCDSVSLLVTEEQLDAAERAGGNHSMEDVFGLFGAKLKSC